MSSLLEHLNPEQLQAVTLPNQSALILAGAGVFVTSTVSGLDYVVRWSGRALRSRG